MVVLIQVRGQVKLTEVLQELGKKDKQFSSTANMYLPKVNG
jgi:hypothetical protein